MDEVLFERPSDHIALVTLNRPDARNAIGEATALKLDQTVAEVEADPDIWVAILTGAGGAVFCAGADLKVVAQGKLDSLFTPTGGFAGFVNAPRSKPWIAAVEGLALAGGFELALACDLIVASEGSGFALPEVKRGLVASAGGLYRLPRALPRALALEMIITGRRMASERAHALGLINILAAKGEAVDRALELAAHICENAPLAVRESLHVARRTHDFDDETLRRLGDEAQDRLSLTADFAEGPLAFIEKRAPVWKAR